MACLDRDERENEDGHEEQNALDIELAAPLQSFVIHFSLVIGTAAFFGTEGLPELRVSLVAWVNGQGPLQSMESRRSCRVHTARSAKCCSSINTKQPA